MPPTNLYLVFLKGHSGAVTQQKKESTQKWASAATRKRKVNCGWCSLLVVFLQAVSSTRFLSLITHHTQTVSFGYFLLLVPDSLWVVWKVERTRAPAATKVPKYELNLSLGFSFVSWPQWADWDRIWDLTAAVSTLPSGHNPFKTISKSLIVDLTCDRKDTRSTMSNLLKVLTGVGRICPTTFSLFLQ